jgi:hypothetical protein
VAAEGVVAAVIAVHKINQASKSKIALTTLNERAKEQDRREILPDPLPPDLTAGELRTDPKAGPKAA